MTPGDLFLIATPDNMPERWREAVVAIGNFDGVHAGHQAVLAAAQAQAAHLGAPLIMLTFEPHPRTFFRPEDPVFRLTPATIKGAVAGAAGVDGVLVMAFDRELSAMGADDFVRDILVGKLAIRHAVTGYDFHFGHRRQGTPDFLKQAGIIHQFGVTIVAEHGDEDGAVSSTRIRETLADGAVADARLLLGWTWSVDGTVIHGEKRGRTLGFPTANMELNAECRLRHGIYAVRFVGSDGVVRDGVASYGRRPTFGDGPALLETFLFGFSGDLYGQPALVSLVDWIRAEMKFDSVDELVSRMKQDCDVAQLVLSEIDTLPPLIPQYNQPGPTMYRAGQKMINPFEGARILITGASSGIGLCLTRRLHEAGGDILGLGRRPDHELPGDFPAVAYRAVDLSITESAGQVVECAGKLGWDTLDYCILNAGTGHFRPVEAEDTASIAGTIQANMTTPLQLVHAFSERLLAARGKVVLVGSVAHRGAAGFPVYAASKGALDGFARSLRSEWRGRINAQILHPGPTATDMHQRAGYDPGWKRHIFFKPDDIAEAMVRQMGRNRSPVTIGYRMIMRMKETRFFRGGR